MDRNMDRELQAATHHLGTLLNDVITESPRVVDALRTLRADGYDVVIEVSLAFQPAHSEKTSPARVKALEYSGALSAGAR